MAATTSFKDKYFLIKWVYVETIAGGQTILKNGVSKLYNHLGQPGYVWLNEFLDCYLSEDDCFLFGALIEDGFKVWIKCIHEPQQQLDVDTEIMCQPCFLCVECEEEDDVKYLKDFLNPSPCKFINLDVFPWAQSATAE